MSPEISVVDNPGAARYELRVDRAVAGFITYRLKDDSITLLHSEMNPELEGEGLGSRLAAGTLDDARARGLAVKPVCPFVVAFIESHPEYADLVR